jgi:ribonuclease T2
VRPIRPANKVFIPLFVVAVALMASWVSQRKGPPPAVENQSEPVEAPDPPRNPSFDFYLLALTSHPAFCADGHARERECRAGDSLPISIHGLWPERLAPGQYPHDCAGPALDLEPGTERDLAALMPGMVQRLHEHEWRKHGTCSGLDDDQYFQAAVQRAGEVDRVLGPQLTTYAGRQIDAVALRAAVDQRAPGMSGTLTFHCRTLRDAPRRQRRDPFLVEIRQCIERDERGAPGEAVSCATVDRRDQGCGRSFRIAEAR